MDTSNLNNNPDTKNSNEVAENGVEKVLNFGKEISQQDKHGSENVQINNDPVQNNENSTQKSKPIMTIKIPDGLNNQEFAQKPLVEKNTSLSARKSPKRRFLNEDNQPKLASDDKLIRYILSYAIGFADDNYQGRDYLDDYMMHLKTVINDSEDQEEDFNNYQELDSKCGSRIDKKQIEEMFIDKYEDNTAEIKKLEEELFAKKNEIIDESNTEEKYQEIEDKEHELKLLKDEQVKKYIGVYDMQRELFRFYWNMLLEIQNKKLVETNQEKEKLEKFKQDYEVKEKKWEEDYRRFEEEHSDWELKERKFKEELKNNVNKDEIAKYKQMIKFEMNRNEDILNDSTKLAKNLVEEKDRTSSLKKEKENLEQSLMQKLKEIESYKKFDDERAKFEEKIKKLEQEITKLNAQLSQLKRDLADSKSQNSEQNDIILTKSKTIAKLEQIQGKNEFIINKIKKFDQLRLEIARDKKEFKDQIEKSKEELENHLRAKENKILGDISREQAKLTQNVNEYESKYEKYLKELDEFQKKQYEFYLTKSEQEKAIQTKKEEVEKAYSTLKDDRNKNNFKQILILICLAIIIFHQIFNLRSFLPISL